MGCIFSTYSVDHGDVDRSGAYEAAPFASGDVYVFVPGFRVPQQLDFTEVLKGSTTVSAGMAAKLQWARSQVVRASARKIVPAFKSRRKISEDGDHGGVDLEKALIDYLPLLLGLVNGGDKPNSVVEYSWTNVEDEKKGTTLRSGHYELLSVLHLLGMLALQEANACLTPSPMGTSAHGYITPKATQGMCFALHPVFTTFGRYISASFPWYILSDENKRNAIEILLKAASYFECAINSVMPNMPNEIKEKLPADLTKAMLRSLEQQALGQVVEVQLGFAIDNMKASLAVRRRLACEQVEVWEQAIEKLACVPLGRALGDKHLLFVKWKLAEAKAACYYFHGLILDKGYKANSHAEALSCLKVAYANLKESQKARTEFRNMGPPTKVPPLWGPMKYLAETIPRETLIKGHIFKDHYFKEKLPATTPKLPEFAIALEPDPFRLPLIDPAWKNEPGFESSRPSQIPDAPSFQASKQQPPMRSDLRRAVSMAPPFVVSEMAVGAR